MSFKIKIEPDAVEDIQQGIEWYNKQLAGLGKKFLNEIRTHINLLKHNPYYQIRYDNVHCIPLKKFPFMIHFTINKTDNLVIIRAVFNTSRNPNLWVVRE
ncbi:MAG: hypothetical protein CO127_00170 [Ignavibacteria bacterium CG_4_9_14_3_um_filter_36_18]|nr:MAG: hypothetical protein CO127_00170 [Ignavibacteria bacterium CG_4_9_14_3_um_filter_36_18]